MNVAEIERVNKWICLNPAFWFGFILLYLSLTVLFWSSFLMVPAAHWAEKLVLDNPRNRRTINQIWQQTPWMTCWMELHG